MAGGKGKSIGGKGGGAKDSATKSQKSHSAKAGLQVSLLLVITLRSKYILSVSSTRLGFHNAGPANL